MANNTQDQESNSAQTEQQLKDMLGPYPRDTKKQVDKPKEDTPIDHTHLQPAHEAGSVITPNQPVEKKETEPNKEPEKSWDKADHKSKGKIKRFFKAWWGNPKARWATICAAVVIFFGVILFPTTRYFVLNNIGVRSSAQVTVLDDTTQLPLKNVKVSIAGVSGQTDSDGQVRLKPLKLGSTNLVIEKRAFATHTQPITIGWGSNPLGDFKVKAVGVQYSFTVTDWLSGKPIKKAEATSGEAFALSDDKGKILLNIDPSEVNDNLAIKIAADDYRTEQSAPGTSTANIDIKMVPARKEVFISNRSGKYDLYTIDVDGKNEKLVLPGSGLERDSIALVPHPTDETTALVSSRVNIRNVDGYLLDSLTLVNLKDKSTTAVAQSENIQIIGWSGQRLVYVQIAAGASASNPNRYRLVSYDYKTAAKKELAKANSFNDVILIGNNIYYAPYGGLGSDSTGLFKINVDGSSKQTLLSKEVWNIFRNKYDTFDLSVSQEWYQYKIGDSNAVKLNQAPASQKSRVYVASPDAAHNLWIDQRDGKGVLLNYTQSTNEDKILRTQSGLIYPVRWLTDTVFIYRVSTPTETADYVMSTEEGDAKKIKDVYNAGGIDRWYYY